MMKDTKPFSCDDCGVDTSVINEWYMVEDDIWQKYGSAHFLCIGCLENRLGRALIADDFMNVPTWEMSPRLRDRISRLPDRPPNPPFYKKV